MSTYYYLICDKCKEVTPAGSRTAGGYCHVADSDLTLLPFIIAHGYCNAVMVVSEHDDHMKRDLKESLYEWWTSDNYESMIHKAKQVNRWR